MTTPLISVIVPTYNRAYCLPRTLDSVLAQTHTRFEVIIIDDGSTDATGDLIARSYVHDPRIKYFYQQNKGVSIARNQGLARSQGDYIALLDSDDVWMPWKLQLQLASFRQCPEMGMVWTDMKAIGPVGNVVSNAYLRTMYHAYRWFSTTDLFPRSYSLLEATLPPELAGARLHVGDIFSQMVMGSLVHTSTVMLSRERFEKVGGFNEAIKPLGEDYDFHLRTCREGPVGFIDVSSIQYQTGISDQLTRTCNRVHSAFTFMATVQEVLRKDRDRIKLPRNMLRGLMAEMNDWAGEALLNEGQRKEARKYLLESLRHKPLQLRTLALLVRATLPKGLSNSLHSCWRLLKSVSSHRTAH